MSEQQVAGSAPGAEINKTEAAIAAIVKPPEAAPKVFKTIEERAKEMIAEEMKAAEEAEKPADPVSPDTPEEPAEEAESDATEEVDEEEELVKEDDPESFKKRVEKLGSRIEEAKAERDEIAGKYEALVNQVSELRNVERVAQDFQTVAEIDPALKEIVEKHWFFKGRMPTLEDFDGDQAAFSRMVEVIHERRASAKVEAEKADTVVSKSAEEKIAAYEKEGEKLKSHPIYGQFITDAELAKAYDFIAGRVKAGDYQYDTLEKAFDVLFREKVAAAWKKRGAEDAVKRMDASRKTSKLVPKGAPAAKSGIDPAKWKTMTTVEKARYLTRMESGA